MEHARRLRALKYLRLLSCVQCALGLLLLVLLVIAANIHGPVNQGLPYYVGAAVTCVLPIVMTFLGCCIFIRGQSCQDKQDAAQMLGCLMQVYAVLSIVELVICVATILLTGVTGICATGGCSYADEKAVGNRILATFIIVFISVCAVTSAMNLVVLCKHSYKYFGVRLLTQGKNKVSTMETPAEDAFDGRTVSPPILTVIEPVLKSPPNHHRDHPDYPDPRLASPPADYSTEHLQHYLTQQYKKRIRNRRKRSRRKKNRVGNHVTIDEHISTGENMKTDPPEKRSSCVLPPIQTTCSRPPRAPSLAELPPPSVSPLLSPVTLPDTPTPLMWACPIERPSTPCPTTPPESPPNQLVMNLHATDRSPPPLPAGVYPSSPSPTMTLASTPVLSEGRQTPSPSYMSHVVHVIPYGGYSEQEDEEVDEYAQPYSP